MVTNPVFFSERCRVEPAKPLQDKKQTDPIDPVLNIGDSILCEGRYHKTTFSPFMASLFFILSFDWARRVVAIDKGWTVAGGQC